MVRRKFFGVFVDDHGISSHQLIPAVINEVDPVLLLFGEPWRPCAIFGSIDFGMIFTPSILKSGIGKDVTGGPIHHDSIELVAKRSDVVQV